MCDEDSEVVRSSPLTAKGLNGISVSGSGDVDVEALESERFEVSVSGTGNLDIARGAIGDQDIKISGSGSVRYVGQPEIHSAVSGVGNVRQISEQSYPMLL